MKKQKIILLLLFIGTLLYGESGSSIKLKIIRYTNNGRMGMIPCYLRISDKSKIKSFKIEDYNDIVVTNYSKTYDSYFLVGGDTAYILLSPGIYDVSVYTPIAVQGKYIDINEHIWKSNKYKINMANKDKVIYILPTTNNDGYDGGWIITDKKTDYPY